MYKLDLRVSSCIISTEATQFHGLYLSWFRICLFGQLQIFHQIFMFKYWKLVFLFNKSKPLPKWFYCLNLTGCGLWTLIQLWLSNNSQWTQSRFPFLTCSKCISQFDWSWVILQSTNVWKLANAGKSFPNAGSILTVRDLCTKSVSSHWKMNKKVQ